jgi:ADP-heptose:LPS heptosyltransferase
MYNRIAFLKLCCPGDLLFTTPAVKAMNKSFPKSELYYMTGAYSRFVPEHNPHIKSVVTLAPPFEMTGGFRNLRAMAAGIKALAGNDFDLVVSFHRSPTVATMARLAGIKHILGFDTSKPPATISAPFDSNAHEVRRYLNLVAAVEPSVDSDASASIEPRGEEMEYNTTPLEDEEADLFLRVLDITGPFAVIAPGGGENPGTRMPTKRWPASKFRDVVSYLKTKLGLQTISVGSEGEMALAETIGADKNLAGKTTFPLLAAILKRSAIFIGNDSGPLYLASAVGARTIGIYGPSSPDLVAPLGSKHISVLSLVNCHPCYHPDKLTRGEITCPIGTWACMLTLGSKTVIEAINKLLTLQPKVVTENIT